jgi:hypothetical protein
LRSQCQTEHDKEGDEHVSVVLVFFIIIEFCASGTHAWFSKVQRRRPQDIISEIRFNDAVLFFLEDLKFVQAFRSQFDMDLSSIDAVRQLPSFRIKAANDEFSSFDSEIETISLPDRVSRIVAFKFCQLQYGSSTGIITIFQINLCSVESMFLVSVDTSFDRNSSKKFGLPVRMERIEELGCSLIRALTEFNSKMTDAPITSLHIPEFPRRLGINSRMKDKDLTRALVAGMAKGYNQQYSPTVTMQTLH